MCSWDDNHFPLPALINLALSPALFHFLLKECCSLKEYHLTPFGPINLPHSWPDPGRLLADLPLFYKSSRQAGSGLNTH